MLDSWTVERHRWSIPVFWQCCSVRVANELGAGNGKGAKFATIVSVVSSSVIGIFFWTIIVALHDKFAYIFTSSPIILRAVNKLAVLLAFTILLNSVQPILSGTYAYINPSTSYTYIRLHNIILLIMLHKIYRSGGWFWLASDCGLCEHWVLLSHWSSCWNFSWIGLQPWSFGKFWWDAHDKSVTKSLQYNWRWVYVYWSGDINKKCRAYGLGWSVEQQSRRWFWPISPSDVIGTRRLVITF